MGRQQVSWKENKSGRWQGAGRLVEDRGQKVEGEGG